MIRTAALSVSSLVLLGACSSGVSTPIIINPTPVVTEAEAPIEQVQRPRARPATSSMSLLGSSARALLSRYGNPRIDRLEGEARKLQFAGDDCVVDIYLYPQTAGAERVATFATARLRDGGSRVNADQCLAGIERR